MKSLRKSLNVDKGGRQHISTPLLLPNVSKPAPATAPPQKVIRAISAYRSRAPQELSFQKGDFFYVIKEVDSNGSWYEAHNPVSGARGLVPRSMFEEFSKTKPIPTNLQGSLGIPQSRPDSLSSKSPKSPKTQVFYAVVLHDFVAERADELDAKAGDPISVVAQSNREWFVAKPIGRLGRPGLIPVTFVEVRDPVSDKPIPDVDILMDRGDLPKVEDWKKAMLSYKQNSITLGVLDDNTLSVPNSPFMTQAQASEQPSINVQSPSPNGGGPQSSIPPQIKSSGLLPEGILLSAAVVSFHYENEEYWFRIDAIYQPYAASARDPLPHALQLVLFRVYNDFYDFQVSMLNSFPREAGREPPSPRILPYMPGPTDKVTQEITASRRVELNDYLHKLCELKLARAKYILESNVVREFMMPKPGDVENQIESQIDEIEALPVDDLDKTVVEDYTHHVDAIGNGEEGGDDVGEVMDRMKIKDQDGNSDGSEYEDEPQSTSSVRRSGNQAYNPYHDPGRLQNGSQSQHNLRQNVHSHNHRRAGSTSPFDRGTSSYSVSHSRSNSPMDRIASPLQPNHHTSASRSGPGRSPLDPENRYSDQSRASPTSLGAGILPSPTSTHSSQTRSSRSRSVSNATSNLTSPPISAGASQAAFIKIKIFDQMTDDLIAIRVHPRVTHNELMDKVQARLGGDVLHLRYRDSMTNTYVGLDSDNALRDWLNNTEKHVLFAD